MSSQTDAHSMLPTMLGSALSGMAGRVPFHPVDTIKARMQVNVGAAQGRASYSTTLSGLRHVFHSEGLRGLYRGFGIAFWGGAPGACTYFTGYELTRNKLQEYEWGRKYPSMVHLAAGFCAEAGSCVFWVPIDVVKETLQVQPYSAEGKAPAGGQGIYYKNSLHTMRTVYRSRGFQGVYRVCTGAQFEVLAAATANTTCYPPVAPRLSHLARATERHFYLSGHFLLRTLCCTRRCAAQRSGLQADLFLLDKPR